MSTKKGFIFETGDGSFDNGGQVSEFVCICHKCGSADTTLNYTFTYYGGMTGYNHDLTLCCRNCDNRWDASM